MKRYVEIGNAVQEILKIHKANNAEVIISLTTILLNALFQDGKDKKESIEFFSKCWGDLEKELFFEKDGDEK